MGVAYRQVVPGDAVVEEIVVDGKVVGTVFRRMEYKAWVYYASFRFAYGEKGAGIFDKFVRGYGATKEEAIRAALSDGKAEAQRIVKDIGVLTSRLFG